MFEVEGLQATYDTPQGLGTRPSFPLGLGSSAGHCARLFTYTDLFLTAAARVTLQVGKWRLKEVTWLAWGRGAGKWKSQDFLCGASGLRCELALSFRVVGGSGSCPREFFGAGGRSLRDLQRRWTACTCSSSGPSPPSLCSCPSRLPEVLPPPGTEAGPVPEYHVTQHLHLPGSCFPSGKQIHNV